RGNMLRAAELTGSGDARGGGLHLGGSATIEASVIEHNVALLTTPASPTGATGQGAGVFFSGTELRLGEGVRVADNVARAEASASSAAYGGGIASSSGTLIATRAHITTNLAESTSPNSIAAGGGVYAETTSVALEECDVA